MSVREDCRYAQTHEWFHVDGDTVTVGITKFAADQLTDITYVELPDVGTDYAAGDSFGEIESVKSTSDLYTAVAGSVIAVNEALADQPGLVNEDSQGEGWMIKLKASDLGSLEKLMDAAAYKSFTAE